MFLTGPLGYLLLVTSSIGILMAALMLVQQRPIQYYFFGTNLICYSYSALTLAAVKTKWLLIVPHMFLTAQPLLFLIGPLNYFFITYSINPNRPWRKTDAFHLVPFLVQIAMLVPFYILDAQSKREIILQAYGAGDRMIPPAFDSTLTYFQHIFLKAISIFIYSTLSLKIILVSYRSSMKSFQQKNSLLYAWISLETILKILFGFTGILKAILNTEHPVIDLIFTIYMSLEPVIGFSFILLNPGILYGLKPFQFEKRELFAPPQPDPAEHQTSPNETGQPHPTTEAIKDKDKNEFAAIESYFQTKKPFLQEEMTREIIAHHLGIPQRRISAVIKSVVGLSFSDYVNSYRIRYLEENACHMPEWKKFTIDAIGLSIGFANRISFYHATKRHRNMTPTDLLKSLGIGTETT